MTPSNRPLGLTEKFALFIATAGGAGFLPKAPGTWGTCVAVPIAWAFNAQPDLLKISFWIGLLAVGTWAAGMMDRMFSTSDNQKIVIDEVIGYGISAWVAGQDWRLHGIAFVAFRLFDILKPYPARVFDRHSKTSQNGVGVMMDDVVAGVYGLFVVIIAKMILT